MHGQTSSLARREALTQELYSSPYSPYLYLERATCHQDLGYPDLAAGDAYKALLLIDDALDESVEYHEQALEAVNKAQDCCYDKDLLTSPINGVFEDIKSKDSPTPVFLSNAERVAYRLLANNLMECGCLKSAYTFCKRGLRVYPEDSLLEGIQAGILERNRETKLKADPDLDGASFDPNLELSDRGHARRELYPWNAHEPDRHGDAHLAELNKQLETIAPKCVAKVVDLPLLSSDRGFSTGMTKQLGIFADADITSGEVVLHESSILAANNRLYDPLCDACCDQLPSDTTQSQIFACEECDDTVFCSQSCLDASMQSYHQAVCGKDIDAIGRDVDPKEAADALYFLLVGRTIAMSETRDIHPLDLKETNFLWGEWSPSTQSTGPHLTTLPFSFTYNILYPIHLLEKMDLDIYATLPSYDFWILNTLYAKFRGVASGRVNPRNGRPEVCAVHPLWCLANHSCAPNVRWNWGAEIKFYARRGEEVVRWGEQGGDDDVGGEERKGGIKKGEEILNHYCDVELDVKARREWASGALGGICMCERCAWESGQLLDNDVQ